MDFGKKFNGCNSGKLRKGHREKCGSVNICPVASPNRGYCKMTRFLARRRINKSLRSFIKVYKPAPNRLIFNNPKIAEIKKSHIRRKSLIFAFRVIVFRTPSARSGQKEACMPQNPPGIPRKQSRKTTRNPRKADGQNHPKPAESGWAKPPETREKQRGQNHPKSAESGWAKPPEIRGKRMGKTTRNPRKAEGQNHPKPAKSRGGETPRNPRKAGRVNPPSPRKAGRI